MSFIENFYGISVTRKDLEDFELYSKVILIKNEGKYPSQIYRLLNMTRRKVEHWVYENCKPFIIRLLEHHLELGMPKSNFKWLSLNSTRGGLFTGPWIQVPNKIESFNDIEEVIKQLKFFYSPLQKNDAFDLQNIKKGDLFAFFLGMLLGDSSKTGIKRKQRTTRRVHVRLTKAHKTNKQLGDYTSLCVNALGLRMKQCKDCPAGKLNTYDFYTWISQSSILIQWIFDVCLGLQNNELTTYDKVRMNWILETPREFRIAFLQGLTESDGFVDFSSHQVGVITEPNTELIKRIFDSLNIKPTPKLLTKNRLWCLILNLKDAYNLPVLNPKIRSYRYQQMEKLFKAARLPHHYPPWLKEKISNYLKEGITGTALVKKILEEEGIAIRTAAIRRISKLES